MNRGIQDLLELSKNQMILYSANAKIYFKNLSKREKYIAIFIVFVLIIVVIDSISSSIMQVFSEQTQRMANVDQEMRTVSLSLARYMKFKARLQEIEGAYKQVEFKEGEKSHLAQLIKNKAGITTGVPIQAEPVTKFGEEYEQATFTMSFTTSDFKRLIDLLKELVHGEKPLILSEITLRKRATGDSLTVSLKASSIRTVE